MPTSVPTGSYDSPADWQTCFQVQLSMQMYSPYTQRFTLHASCTVDHLISSLSCGGAGFVHGLVDLQWGGPMSQPAKSVGMQGSFHAKAACGPSLPVGTVGTSVSLKTVLIVVPSAGRWLWGRRKPRPAGLAAGQQGQARQLINQIHPKEKRLHLFDTKLKQQTSGCDSG